MSHINMAYVPLNDGRVNVVIKGMLFGDSTRLRGLAAEESSEFSRYGKEGQLTIQPEA